MYYKSVKISFLFSIYQKHVCSSNIAHNDDYDDDDDDDNDDDDDDDNDVLTLTPT